MKYLNDEFEVLLSAFINHKISSYTSTRNYDYGPTDRSNVSLLSKFLSHRLLLEYELINYIKKKTSGYINFKFIDEILWRIYWRGYLEGHSEIWFNYKSYNNLKFNNDIYHQAINGKTGIVCFNNWVDELKTNNYLHNHSRMWFASIWIFGFNLPWELGANFFLEHLFDGDSASNTLSWRWVAGLHTNKKPYLAKKENIKKYTKNRFNPKEINFLINNNTSERIKKFNYKCDRKFFNKTIKSEGLIISENDLSLNYKNIKFSDYKEIFFLHFENNDRFIKLSDKVIKFKKSLIESASIKIKNSKIINSSEINKYIKDDIHYDVIYPGVGDCYDFLKSKILNISFIFRENDIKYWSNANSGFYKFKKSIEKINFNT